MSSGSNDPRAVVFHADSLMSSPLGHRNTEAPVPQILHAFMSAGCYRKLTARDPSGTCLCWYAFPWYR